MNDDRFGAFSQGSLAGCDSEPIHIPESIQPHGLLLVVDSDLRITREAGRFRELAGRDSLLREPVSSLVGEDVAERLSGLFAASDSGFAGRWTAPGGRPFDVIARSGGNERIVELEPGSEDELTGVELLSHIDAAAAGFERASSSARLVEDAAQAFRDLTGFERVMIYRFLDDEAGQVIAESAAPGLETFRNHHFPASDIPLQARRLYLRNPVRVIPDAAYLPEPLQPAGARPLDMSDCGLRSVSPVHLQYLKNMEVRASASVSIIVNDELWGLVACHSSQPQLLPYERRMAATTLVRNLARQLRARGEGELYRERIRLRRLEDELVEALSGDRPLHEALAEQLKPLQDLVGADGVALLGPSGIVQAGSVPPPDELPRLAQWVSDQPGLRPVFTHQLSSVWPNAAQWTGPASGFLGIRVPGERPLSLMWFRAEIIETIRWAGDPSTAVNKGPAGRLTPRASFAAWSETVTGRSRRWTQAQVESAARFREALLDVAELGQLQRLNRTLRSSLDERDHRIQQQSVLMREVNHRVQNSLTLVSSFLGLQARQAEPGARTELLEARRRVRAVSMVHSRLYRADNMSTIDLSRYLGELVEDLGASMGADWSAGMTSELAPVCVEPGRAVTLGLILTELVINAQKYAYDGAAGPIRVDLEEDGALLRLSVRDKGRGRTSAGAGFGSMMIDTLVGQLRGRLDYRDAQPGLNAVLSAPVSPGP